MAGDDARSFATRTHDHSQAYESAVSAAGTDHGGLAGLGDDDHTQYLLDKASGGVAAEVPTHTHADAANAGTVAHSALTGIGTSDHHVKYTDAEAVAATAASYEAAGAIATHAAIADAHHAKYTDAEAVTAVESDDTIQIDTSGTGGALVLPLRAIVTDPGSAAGSIVVPIDGSGYVNGNPHVVKGDLTSNYRLAYTADITTHEGDTTSAHDALGVDITDSGSYFTGTTVEAALQEVGATLNSGSSFPGGPSTDDRYYHTTHDMWFRYDGTRWLCECLHEAPILHWWTATVSDASYYQFDPSGLDVYMIDLICQITQTGTPSASEYWTLQLEKRALDNTNTGIWSDDTQSDSGSPTWNDHTASINAVLDVSATPVLRPAIIITLGTSTLYGMMKLTYRFIGT